jgi:hypothetical protein
MGRTVLCMLVVWLAGVGASAAQSLPEGTFASTEEGCTKLAAKTQAELGDDFDFTVLTSKGLTGYQQACDFVNVTAHNATSWVATAFCDEAGYTYPDLFAIVQKEEGKLAVTRMTDLTQQGASESPEDSQNSEAADQDESAADTAKTPEALEGGQDQDQSEDASDQTSPYVRCQNVKQ